MTSLFAYYYALTSVVCTKMAAADDEDLFDDEHFESLLEFPAEVQEAIDLV